MAFQFLTFDAALEEAIGHRRHLLLGNGFSIALFPDRFRYQSLLEQAVLEGLFDDFPEIPEAFELLQTTDFEVVLQALVKMTKLIHLYVPEEEPKQSMLRDAEKLKEALVVALAGRHPARLSEIVEGQFQNCRNFLLKFAGKGLEKPGCIYTLNYDLLLYWTLLHEPEGEGEGFHFKPPPAELLIKHDDGFRNPEDPESPYVAWDVDGGSNSQNIHFLHGGLHLFDAGTELQKYCWERAGGIPLMDQIRVALDEERYPLFVAEGSSASKLEKILHSGYLVRSYKSFAGICNSRNNAVFVFGHSLASSDEHILKLMEAGKFCKLFISLHGTPADNWNKPIIERALKIRDVRERNDLEVYFYDAASANVWG